MYAHVATRNRNRTVTVTVTVSYCVSAIRRQIQIECGASIQNSSKNLKIITWAIQSPSKNTNILLRARRGNQGCVS
jgi:hypothetical protein